MSKGAKILLAVAATVALLVLGSGLLLAATVVRAGTMTVRIHEPGQRIDLRVPAALAYLGIDLLPLVLDDDVHARVRAGLGEMRPAVAAALRDLEDVPDAVLVDVRDGRESVRIAKKDHKLQISVVDAKGRYEITLPEGVLGRVANAIR